MNRVDTVLFDLDGTMLDTASDMGNALNTVLIAHAHAPLAQKIIRPYVSKGGMALVRLGFGLNDDGDDDNAQTKILYDQLLAVYRENLTINTRLFAGMESLLRNLEESGRRFGIVTNKPTFLTEPLLAAMKLDARMACVVCGDTLKRRKPYPDQLQYACEIIGANPAHTIYIGDDARDIQAGQRAQMRTLAAAYGYIIATDDPHAWGADAVIEHPDEIQQWLEKTQESKE